MLLRALVGQFVRNAAEQKLREVATEAMHRHTSGADSQSGDGEGGDGEGGDGEGGDGEGGEPIPRQRCRIAVLFGHKVEAGGSVDLLDDVVTTRFTSLVEHVGRFGNEPIAMIEAGEGTASARQATLDVIQLHQPDWIVSAGFSSALTAELKRGVVLMADQVSDSQGKSLEVGFKISPDVVEQTQGLSVGRLVTVEKTVTTPEERQELQQKYDACACDLESSAIAQVCSEKGVRFMAIRVITDLLDDELPVEIERLNNQESFTAKMGVAAGAVFHRLSSVKDMWRFKEEALRASDRLARFLSGVLPQLGGGPKQDS